MEALRGHLLRFDPPPARGYRPGQGVRLLVLFVALELALGPRWGLLPRLGASVPGPWIVIPADLALALLGVRLFARVPLSEIGLRRWRDWTAAERWYFVQVAILANVIFLAFARQAVAAIVRAPDPGWAATLALELLWGFHQELVYRGILQTELVRRWGAALGVLTSNLLFTFGPLHIYHLTSRPLGEAIAVLAFVFAIGLFFGILFHRSRNLWMVGVFHGIGDAWLQGVPAAAGR